MNVPPDEIGPEETVGHQINSKTKADECARGIRWRAIFQYKCRRDLSVDRLHPNWYADVVQIATDQQITQRQPKCFYGWVVVTPQMATQCGRELCPSGTCRNPYHADIWMPHGAGTCKVVRRRHASHLVSLGAWWQPSDAPALLPVPSLQPGEH